MYLYRNFAFITAYCYKKDTQDHMVKTGEESLPSEKLRYFLCDHHYSSILLEWIDLLRAYLDRPILAYLLA
jgi:hypothetical protein